MDLEKQVEEVLKTSEELIKKVDRHVAESLLLKYKLQKLNKKMFSKELKKYFK